MQQLHPLFAEHSAAEERYAREVAIRPAQVGDEPLLHRILARREHDRNGRGSRFCRRRRIAVAGDHGHLTPDQIEGERWQPIGLIVRIAVLNGNVLPLDEAGVFQTLTECRRKMFERRGRRASEEPDHWHRWLLRPRCERPSRCSATEQCDELAPLHHSITSSARASSVGATDTPWDQGRAATAGTCQETSFWHCRTMEMHDFPFRAALGDNKRDTSRIAKSLAVQHAS